VSELPAGWAGTTLGEVAETIRGVTYKKAEAQSKSGDGRLPLLRATNIVDGRLELDSELVYVPPSRVSDAQLLSVGDIVIAASSGSRTAVGKSAPLRHEWFGSFGAFCSVARPRSPIDASYLAYFVGSETVRRLWSRRAAGTSINNLKREHFTETPVPLPPLNEQRRIVAAIEEHLSRLDAADASLESALRRLAAQRRAVLFTVLGHAGPPTVPAAELLSISIGGVWGKEPGADEIDVSVFRVTEFREGGVLDPTTAARRSITFKQLASRELRPNDLLIEKSGGGPDRPVGRVAFVPAHEGPAVSSNFVQLVRPDSARIDPRFLFRWLQRRYLDGSAAAHQTASTNIRNLKATDYLSLPVPLPALEEQRRIVAEIEERLGAIDALRAAIERAQRRGAALRRSVLERAFRGELVPQDPSDEPASVLLDRIRAERAKAEPATGRRPRGRATMKEQ